MCEISRKVNSRGSSFLPGPTVEPELAGGKKVRWQASLDRLLPEILLGHGEKLHLSLIFLSRADSELEAVSVLQERPGDTLPICQFLIIIQFYLSIPHLYPALSIPHYNPVLSIPHYNPVLSVSSSFIPSSLWPWKGQCHLGRGLCQGSSQSSIAPTS